MVWTMVHSVSIQLCTIYRHKKNFTVTKRLPKLDRYVFLRGLRKAVTRCSREDKAVGLLVVQVEQLDKVEGAFGYEVSHKLLKEFGIRLESILRNYDRLILVGDRKFCFILNDLMNEGHAVLAATKIERLATEPFVIDGHSIKLDASIGIAMFPTHATNAKDLARRSELALASARDAGTPFEMYSHGSTVEMASLWHLESELVNALDDSELELYYQPKISLQTGIPCSAEALMRWNHPTRGLVFPDEFIPVADQTGKLEPMTWYAINAALRQQSEWPDLWDKLTVAINLSANVLKSEQLIITIRDSAKIWGLEPQQLILEITEDTLITDPDETFSILKQLQSEGVQIAIDDFGTGYSSMSYFRDMPADELKIDKSFVLNMLNNKRDSQIVRTVIDLAHTFDFAVVAEGVENEAIRNELITMKCDMAQGFLYAPPLPQQEFIEWLKQYQPGDFVQQGSVPGEVLTIATDTKE